MIDREDVGYLIDRYDKAPTGSGLIEAEHYDGAVIIWRVSQGDPGDPPKGYHVGICRVAKKTDGYEIGWYQGTDKQPSFTDSAESRDKLCNMIDAAIKQL
jgi:hypothetical protein